MDNGFNRYRPGGNERVIPISFDGGRQPNPQPPPSPSRYYPTPAPVAGPTRPDRHRYPDHPGNPRISPVAPAPLPTQPNEQSNPDFSDNELDEMDAVMALLRKKRAAEGNTGNNSYKYKSTTNTNYHAETGSSDNTDETTHVHPEHISAEDPNPGDFSPGNDNSPQSGVGFVMPPPLPNSSSSPNSQNDHGEGHDLPYPSNPNQQFGGAPGYPNQSQPGPNFNPYPAYPPSQFGSNPSAPYPTGPGFPIPQPYPNNPTGFQPNYYPPNPYQ